MKIKPLCIALTAVVLSSCGTGENEASVNRDAGSPYATGQLPTAATVQEQTTSADDQQHLVAGAVVGRALSPGGEIPEAERTHRFAAGEQIHLAVPARTLTPQARVRVAWFGPHDDLVAEDAREVSEADQYVSFSIVARDDFDPGEYRAEVWMDDEKIDEQRFAVIAHGASDGRDDSGGG